MPMVCVVPAVVVWCASRYEHAARVRSSGEWACAFLCSCSLARRPGAGQWIEGRPGRGAYLCFAVLIKPLPQVLGLSGYCVMGVDLVKSGSGTVARHVM